MATAATSLAALASVGVVVGLMAATSWSVPATPSAGNVNGSAIDIALPAASFTLRVTV